MSQSEYIELKARCEAQLELTVCNGCTACYLRCADGVQASRTEWETLQAHIASLTTAARTALTDVTAQDKTVDLGDAVTVSLCRYFDMQTLRCAIYPVRPLVCRLLGHVEWLPCPIDKVPRPLPTPKALELMSHYARQERRTFEEWEREVGR